MKLCSCFKISVTEKCQKYTADQTKTLKAKLDVRETFSDIFREKQIHLTKKGIAQTNIVVTVMSSAWFVFN